MNTMRSRARFLVVELDGPTERRIAVGDALTDHTDIAVTVR